MHNYSACVSYKAPNVYCLYYFYIKLKGIAMKKKGYKILIISLVAVLVIAAVVGVVAFINSGHRVIKIEDYKGDVELERDGDEVDIFEGIKLRSEDEITTGERSEAELLCDDDKHILARENTCFTIISKGNKKEGKLEIELLYGATLIDIEEKLPDDYDFEVSTPNASLSVRGTTFEVEYNPELNKTIVNVTDGKVKVKSESGSEMIEKNQVAVIMDDDIVVTSIPQGIVPEPETSRFNPLSGPAFEVEKQGTAGFSGIFVKNLEGFEFIRVGANTELVRDGLHIRYSAVESIEDDPYFNDNDTTQTIVNTDGADIRADSINYDGQNGDINRAFVFYRQYRYTSEPDKSYYLKIMVYDRVGDEAIAKNETAVNYLSLTNTRFYITDTTVEFSYSIGGSEEVVPTAFDFKYYKDTPAFTVRNIYEGKGALPYDEGWGEFEPMPDNEVMPYQLSLWEHTQVTENGFTFDEFVRDGIHIRYFFGLVHDMAIVPQDAQMEQTYLRNDDLATMAVSTYTFGDNIAYLFEDHNKIGFIDSWGNKNLNFPFSILIYDEMGGEALKNYTPEDFIDITKHEFYSWGSAYEAPPAATDTSGIWVEDSDDEPTASFTFFRGGATYEQLEYILGVEKTAYIRDQDIRQVLLEGVWHTQGVTNVYVPAEGDRVYDISDLDRLLAPVMGGSVTELSQLPEYVEISDTKLILPIVT